MALVSVDEVREFFFAAKMHGWAAGAPKMPVMDMPGFKRIIYVDGPFSMIDQYCVVPIADQIDPARYGAVGSPRSSGTTTIWFEDTPVWQMSYMGQYTPEASALVKRALLAAYGEKLFLGGRGPEDFEGDGMGYSNLVEHNDFEEFRGHERVSKKFMSNIEGYHAYMGMMLI